MGAGGHVTRTRFNGGVSVITSFADWSALFPAWHIARWVDISTILSDDKWNTNLYDWSGFLWRCCSDWLSTQLSSQLLLDQNKWGQQWPYKGGLRTPAPLHPMSHSPSSVCFTCIVSHSWVSAYSVPTIYLDEPSPSPSRLHVAGRGLIIKAFSLRFSSRLNYFNNPTP